MDAEQRVAQIRLAYEDGGRAALEYRANGIITWAVDDTLAVLEVLAAAETERDEARASLEEHRIAYTAVTGERDVAQAELERTRHSLHTAVRLKLAAQDQATHLAALEETVRRAIEAHRALPGHQPTAVCEAIDALEKLAE